MVRKRLLLCSAIVLVGFLDWLTTTVGLVFFGAAEANPLLAGLTQSSMLLFSLAKLTAVSLTGAAFYKAMGGAFGQVSCFTSRFMYSGYFASLFLLTGLAVNNIIVIIRI